jgi:hypothetical protein
MISAIRLTALHDDIHRYKYRTWKSVNQPCPELFTMLQLFAASLLLLPSVQAQTSSVAAAWYATWHATEGYPLSSVNWNNYNTMYYAFE